MNETLVEQTIETQNLSKTLTRRIYFIIKRSFDIFSSSLGIIFLLPIALLVKICSLITGDTKSIFYKQKRIGKDGEFIYIYKFRSMIPNADEVLKELLKDPSYAKEWKENQKFEHDPRITKIGNILRKTSIDKLPQLINVFKGDMSLIGITGWWGCNGRSATDYQERLNLEYYYCKNCSLKLDIKCFFKTITAVLFKKGAK